MRTGTDSTVVCPVLKLDPRPQALCSEREMHIRFLHTRHVATARTSAPSDRVLVTASWLRSRAFRCFWKYRRGYTIACAAVCTELRIS